MRTTQVAVQSTRGLVNFRMMPLTGNDTADYFNTISIIKFTCTRLRSNIYKSCRIVSYRIATVSAGSCLYAHIYVRNIINDAITLLLPIPKNGALKLYTTSWLDQNLSNRVLKQLSDSASTTKDGNEFHKLTTLSVKKYFLISYLKTFFCNLYILPLV